MGLNNSIGNMYKFISHTWNTVKGECPHNCSYCFCKRWGVQSQIHFDEKELKTDLGCGNFIFVGSSNDMFAKNINKGWVKKTLEHCRKFNNSYLFQSKNTAGFYSYFNELPQKTVLCTTIETNRFYKDIMYNAPQPSERVMYFKSIKSYKKFVTIEPIMDFDLQEMVDYIRVCEPEQVNIGADSGNNKLPEPSAEKVLQLIEELQKFTVIHKKNNLHLILGKAMLKEPINFKKQEDLQIKIKDTHIKKI